MRSRSRRLAALLAVLLASCAHGATTIELSAAPDRIPADGNSTLTLTAEVRSDGALIAGGVNVVFTTDYGELVPVGGGRGGQTLLVPVQSGYARCLLRSTTRETRANVTGAVDQGGGRLDRIEVGFGGPGGPGEAVDNIIRVSGEHIAYAPEPAYQLVEVIGNGVVSYKGVEIRAAKIHIDLQDYLLIARDYYRGVTVASKPPPYDPKELEDSSKPPYHGEKLVLDLRSFTGAMYSAQLGETIQFTGRALGRTPDRQLPPGTFDMFDVSGISIWIRARRVAIYPHEKIRFEHARFIVNERQVMSLAYHFEPLGYSARAGPAISQWVNYSTQDGWILDVPYYFAVGDRTTNEVRLTRGVRSGVFGRETGLQFLYRHHTDFKEDRGSSDFIVDQLGKNFGLEYDHNQRFGLFSLGSLSLAWPRHRNFFSNAALYTPAGPGSLNIGLNVDYLSEFGEGLSANGNFTWQPYPVQLKSLGGYLGSSLGTSYSRFAGRETYRQSASLSLTKNPWHLWQGATLQPYGGLRFSNEINGAQEASFTFNASWRQQLGRLMNMSLGYTFDTSWNSTFRFPDRHLLTLNWQVYQEGRWNGYAFANYSLGDRTLSASALLDWSLTEHWGVQGQTVFQSSTIGSFAESELWLYRLIGSRELRLRYSIERGSIFFEVDNRY
ncbi:MAG: hypothetical protein HYU66_16975 [Armatimonadetes bacterium]|nr:hypothetical protein [Armatimonadota bacterium]